MSNATDNLFFKYIMLVPNFYIVVHLYPRFNSLVRPMITILFNCIPVTTLALCNTQHHRYGPINLQNLVVKRSQEMISYFS